MELLLIIDTENLKDKEIFEKHLKKEGFNPVENEQFVYTATSTTTTYATKAYILEVVKVALGKTQFDSCKLIFQLDELPFQAYKFDKAQNSFEEAN